MDQEIPDKFKFSKVKEKELLSSLWRRNKKINIAMLSFKKRFRTLYRVSEPFRQSILKIIPHDNSYHDLKSFPLKRIYKKENLNNKKSIEWFLGKMQIFTYSYGAAFQVKILEDQKARCRFKNSRPYYIPLEIRNDTVIVSKSIEKLKGFISRSRNSRGPLNEIEVDDSTSPSNIGPGRGRGQLLYILLFALNSIAPTVIKYSNNHGVKKLLINIPEDLNVTTFLKAYGGRLSNIHNSFFSKTSHPGRPESKYLVEQKIRKALRSFRGKKISNEDLFREASKRTGYPVGTIRRHYSGEIKKVKGAKIGR